jgi:hypothetical protein
VYWKARMENRSSEKMNKNIYFACEDETNRTYSLARSLIEACELFKEKNKFYPDLVKLVTDEFDVIMYNAVDIDTYKEFNFYEDNFDSFTAAESFAGIVCDPNDASDKWSRARAFYAGVMAAKLAEYNGNIQKE